MAENKVQFGLKNVHYALLTEGSTNSWGDPVKVPGAVSLTLDPEGETTEFHADNVTYYKSVANNGYAGSLEMARIPDEMLMDVWGFTQGTTDKVLYEHADAEPKPFALMFEIDGDQNEEMYVFYRCVATRPSTNSETIGEAKDPNTQSVNISCLPLVTGSTAQQGVVKGKTTADTPEGARTGWYSAVHAPTA